MEFSASLIDERSGRSPSALLLDLVRREDDSALRRSLVALDVDLLLLLMFSVDVMLVWVEGWFDTGERVVGGFVRLDDLDCFNAWGFSTGLGRLSLLVFFRLVTDDADESEETGLGPRKCGDVSGCSVIEKEPSLLRGERFLWAVGCCSLAVACETGGTTGAQEASEFMGCFIHVATVEESKSCWLISFLLRCFLADPTRSDLERLLHLAWGMAGGTIASKPEEVPSSLKATHSLLRLLATIV
jgi:hypothetical protein